MRASSLRAAAVAVLAASFVAAQSSAPPDQFFESNGVRIRYVEQGSGTAVVMLHGYTGTADRHFVANGVLPHVAKEHRAIAMDLRGHGKSGKPHDPKMYGDEMARDVIRLLDHLKIQQAHLVGYSLGAMIAGRLVTTNPDRLASVAFVASTPMRDISAADRKFIDDSIAEMESDLPFRSLAVVVQPAGQPMPSDAELRTAVAPLVASNDVKALAAMWRGGGFLLSDDRALKSAKFPMLDIMGTLDINMTRLEPLKKAHPQIKIVLVEGATHGGEQGIWRRPETMQALRELWASAR